ncbi:hypothetical protein FACS189434_11650 [Bacteroidia bacterium]|nr:hypothetical protein FACS189434_11650 [Bacteroidia bacterium]
MKTKTFDAVQFMRERRQQLSEKLSKMSKPEIVEYFRKKEMEFRLFPRVA